MNESWNMLTLVKIFKIFLCHLKLSWKRAHTDTKLFCLIYFSLLFKHFTRYFPKFLEKACSNQSNKCVHCFCWVAILGFCIL